MNFKIITIPFDKAAGCFSNEKFEKAIGGKKIKDYKAELIRVEDEFF